jgi:hypothetical protein
VVTRTLGCNVRKKRADNKKKAKPYFGMLVWLMAAVDE